MSAIDVTSMVAQLMVVESRPLNVLATKQKTAQSKIDAFAKLQGGVSNLQTAVEKLAKPRKKPGPPAYHVRESLD